MKNTLGELKGIVFEVEPLELSLFSRLATMRDPLMTFGDQPRLRKNLRAAMRLQLYIRNRCFVAVGPDFSPIPYWQPAMEEPLTMERAVLLHLMVYCSGQDDSQIKTSVSEIVDFVYDDLYVDAYGGLTSVELPNFKRHVSKIKQRVSTTALAGAVFAKYRLLAPVAAVLERARDENLLTHLL